MDLKDKAESTKNTSNTPQKVPLDVTNNTPKESRRKSSEGVPNKGDTSEDLPPTTNPAAFGYDEVKGTRPANLDENGYSSPTNRCAASDYLVPRSSVSYEPVSVPDPEVSYEVPRLVNTTVPLAPSPPSSGYMPLQSRTKSPEHYASKENISKSSSKEQLKGLPRSGSKEIITSARKGSRELVKTPSISKGLNDAVSDVRRSATCSSLGTWLSVAALIVALVSLVFSIASLGASTGRTSGNSDMSNDNLAVRVDGIQSQLQAVASQRPNCTVLTRDSCSIVISNTTSVPVKYECRTELYPSNNSVSSVSCVVDTRSSELSVDQLEVFTTSLLQDSEGFGCSCSYSNNSMTVAEGSLATVGCLLTFTHCF